MDKAIEEQHKADYWERRAQIAESNCTISADDPEAIAKLTDKLTALQEYRDRLKKLNSKHISFLKNPDFDLSDMTEKEQAIIRTYGTGTRCEPHPVARFQFTNLSARIRDVKKRIETLQSKPKESKEKNIAGIIVRENAEENRIQLIFPGKPAEEVRKRLKSYGFRWCPTNGAWQQFLNNNSKYETNLFLEPFVEGKWKI
jgi:vacuolar-type H+-ATPase subunit I/STV1